MAIIGRFKRTTEGLEGFISTLALKSKLQFTPIDGASSDAKNPAYRIMAGSMEVGAAWQKFSRLDKREYLQCRIDDPIFAEPLYASLVAVGDALHDYVLLWTRQSKQ